jgi:Cu+-exporting ATPase
MEALMANDTVETIQMKVSGMVSSFCTMSIERALKRDPGVKSVLVNLVHGVILVEADMSKIILEKLAATSSVDTEVS